MKRLLQADPIFMTYLLCRLKSSIRRLALLDSPSLEARIPLDSLG
jgi:hypothetical protein